MEFILRISLLTRAVLAYDNGAPHSRLPPLGWSSWEAFGAGTQHPVCDYCDENSVKAAVDAFHETGLYDAGYRHFHLDDCWSIAERTSDGLIQPDPARFPNGMKSAIDYAHSKGLTFGLYTSGGKTACVPSRAGSQGHWEQDARSFADWGVDWVKMDWCGGTDTRASYHEMSKALNATGRPIGFNMCEWGEDNPWEWGGSLAQSWRITKDHAGTWASTKDAIQAMMRIPREHGGRPWAWNDMDMLQTGNGPQSGYDPTPGYGPATMSEAEYVTEFSMWAIAGSPLLVTTPIMNCTMQEASAYAASRSRKPLSGRDAPCTVSLAKQLSQAPCVFGDSFGCFGTQANKTMWVDTSTSGHGGQPDEGCRGIFVCDGVTDVECNPMTPAGGNPHHVCPCSGKPGPGPSPSPAPTPVNPPKGKCVGVLNGIQKKVLLNKEVIAINQDESMQGFPVVAGDSSVWARRMSDGSVALALYNEDDTAKSIGAAFTSFGWSDNTAAFVRDLWAHTNNGTATGALPKVLVDAHSTVMVRLTPVSLVV